jgi:hypothetical protein
MKIPPFDFLHLCSGVSLQDFELDRLNQVANLRKDLEVIQDALLQAESEALLARWLIDYRNKLISAGRVQELQASFDFSNYFALPQPARLALPHKIKNSKEAPENVRTKSKGVERSSTG